MGTRQVSHDFVPVGSLDVHSEMPSLWRTRPGKESLSASVWSSAEQQKLGLSLDIRLVDWQGKGREASEGEYQSSLSTEKET